MTKRRAWVAARIALVAGTVLPASAAMGESKAEFRFGAS